MSYILKTETGKQIEQILNEAIKDPTISVGDLLELTKLLYISLVKINGKMLEAVPEQFKDYDLCLAAVNKNGAALRYVPTQLRDYDICMAAVRNTGYAFRDIPEVFQTIKFAEVSVLTAEVEDIQIHFRGSKKEVENLKEIKKNNILKEIIYPKTKEGKRENLC